MLAVVLSLAIRSLSEPGVICTVKDNEVTVLFGTDLFPDEFVMNKFAVVQAGSLQGGEWLDVVDPSLDPPIRFSPYRPGMKRLVIDTRRQRAVTWVERTGKPRIVPAFPKPGRYTLVFADNLETELENMVYWSCRVRVRPGAEGKALPARVEAAPARR